MPGTADLASIINPPNNAALRYGQGKVIAWDASDLSNVIEWRGGRLINVNVAGDLNALTIEPGHVVAMLGWTSENGIAVWWVIGRVLSPQIGAGELVIRDGAVTIAGGTLGVRSDNGVDVVYFGDVTQGEFISRGWIFRFDDGGLAFSLGGVPGAQFWSLYDSAGTRVVTNDTESGAGLGRPYLSYPLAPTTNAEIVGTTFVPTTTSSSYVPIYEGIPSVWHPRVSYRIGISATGVTDWRILANGTVVFTGSPSAIGDFDIPGWGSTVNPGDLVTFTIEARNTGGGLTRVRVLRFEGRQS